MVKIDRILCPVDLSPGSRVALGHAVALARWYEARVTALHVLRQVPVVDATAVALGAGAYVPPVTVPDVDRAAVARRVAEFVASTPGAERVAVRVCDGFDIREEILGDAKDSAADLLVLGSHGHTGVKRLVLGSIAEGVLRHAAVPVLVVPPHAAEASTTNVPFKRIVCAVNFEADSYRALQYAFDLAQEADAELTLLHAVEMPVVHVGAEELSFDLDSTRETVMRSARERLEALVPEPARTYCTVRAEVAEGQAQKAILDLADESRADLIIMGVRTRDALDMAVFGSHVHAVVRAAHCPVLTVHQE
jgi:nucleotide-binding universal stress UspA family protein